MSPRDDLGPIVVVAYVAVGVGVAWALAARGASPGTRAAAVVGWPLLVHLLGGAPEPPPPPPTGPLSDAIERAFARLGDVLVRTGDAGLPWATELDALHEALRAADRRLAVVDRIVADTGDDPPSEALAEGVATLRARRERAADEVTAVLDELARVRVQMGLVALCGDTMPVREGLRALAARVRTLDELAGVAAGEVR